MAVDFYFNPHSHSIPSLAGLRVHWSNVPNDDVVEAIATEAQYLDFHMYVLKSTKHTKHGCLTAPPYEYQLGLSVRAGAIKAALLLTASIAEAVLRAHAEKRSYPLAKDTKRRTFGNVLNAWKAGGKPRKDIAAIWSDLERLRDVRNNVHLFKSAYDPSASFVQVLVEEKSLMGATNKIIDHLQKLVSP